MTTTAKTRTKLLLAVLGLLAPGCGGAAPSVDPDALADGTTFSAPVEIAAGETVTIAPGALILADAGVTITVRGTLRVASATGKHARIAPSAAGAAWGGLIVAAGGKLDADGLDLDGASKALHLLTNSAPSRYDHGTISGVENPFDIEVGARLDTAHATVVGATSSSGVNGELHASYLDYDKTDLNGGIIMGDASAVLDLTDSVLRAPGPRGADYVISYNAKLIRVTYSAIYGSHCAFHFNDVARFELDHVTTGAATPTGPSELTAYGGMFYGSGPGPHVISNSNFVNKEINLDFQGFNGPLTITNTFTTGMSSAPDGTWTWAPADVAAAPIPDARPR